MINVVVQYNAGDMHMLVISDNEWERWSDYFERHESVEWYDTL